MHRNPHWKKLKQAVKKANAFKSSSGQNQQQRVKRLSQVMKSRRNSALEQNTKTEQAKSTATAAQQTN